MWPKFLLIILFVSIIINQIIADDLQIDVLYKPPYCDRIARINDIISMHYRGSLLDGEEFDSSYKRQEPFKFQLGLGQVIKGFDSGLLGMCIGEKRKLTIPSRLAYGDQGVKEVIPPKATLVFEVELLTIVDGESPVNVFKQMDANEDGQLSREEVSAFLKHQTPSDDTASADTKDFEHNNLIEEIFAHEDQNKDGVISREEFSGPKHHSDEL